MFLSPTNRPPHSVSTVILFSAAQHSFNLGDIDRCWQLTDVGNAHFCLDYCSCNDTRQRFSKWLYHLPLATMVFSEKKSTIQILE